MALLMPGVLELRQVLLDKGRIEPLIEYFCYYL